MGNLGTDLRYAARTLVKSPGFAAAAILTLALGIGANAAVWSVVHAVLLRPLPYPHPERLVMLWEKGPQIPRMSFSGPDFLDYRERLARRAFTGLAAFNAASVQFDSLGSDDGPERVRGCTASEGFFQILGTRPALGRTFLPEDHRPGAPPVLVLTEGLWRRRFGADPRIVGRSLTVNGRPATVVGVLPGGFRFAVPGFLRPVEVWTPLSLSPGGDRGGHSLRVLGRLRPGVPAAAVREELAATAVLLARRYPGTNDGLGAWMLPLHEQITGGSRRALLVLLGAVGLVLLTACANVANLLLARAAARRREIAVRTALGAGRLRLLSQLLAESLLLAALGGVLGLLFAAWGLDLLLPLGGANLPRADEIGFDLQTFAATGGAVVLTALLFGLAPALHVTRQGMGEGLRDGERGGGGGLGRRRARSTLAVAEVALALVLSTGAGLLLRSFLGLLDTRPGFTAQGVLAASAVLPRWKYREGAAQAAALRELVARAAALPGVRAAGAIDDLPLDGDRDGESYVVQGRENDKLLPDAQVRAITPGYLEALRIPLRAGRAFTAADAETAPRVALVNQALARRSFPGVDPVGRRLSFDGKAWVEIVGVVADTRDLALDLPPEPEIFLPHAQAPGVRMTLVLAARPTGDTATDAAAAGLAGAVRQAARGFDRDLVIVRAIPMDEGIAAALAERRFHVLLLGLFAAAAFALAALGVYGVVSSGVAERTREIGIRVALGAARGDVLGMVLSQGALLAGAGVLFGTVAALAATRLLAGLLYGVGAADPVTFAAAALLLGSVALFASLLPAARAARLDPVVALKGE